MELEYKLVGAGSSIIDSVCEVMGYERKGLPSIFLVYSKGGLLDEGLLFYEISENPSKMKYVPSHLIQRLFTITEANDKYPELFL